MKNQIKNKTSRAFTLIEMVLYVTILSGIIFVLITFLNIVFQVRVKNQTIQEVDGQGIQILQLMTQTIRNAEGINAPSVGSPSSSLSLNVTTGTNDPTVFDLSASTMQITEGAGAPVNLTSSQIEVTNLTFQNLTKPGTDGIVRIQFTLSYINLSDRNEFDFTRTFYTSVALSN